MRKSQRTLAQHAVHMALGEPGAEKPHGWENDLESLQ